MTNDADRDTTTAPGPTVGDLALAVRRAGLTVVLLVVAFAASGYALGTRADVSYEATSTLAAADPRTQVGVFGRPLPEVSIEPAQAEILAESADLQVRVAERLRIPLAAAGTVEAEVADDGDDRFVTLTASAATRADAVELANTYAEETVTARQEEVRADLEVVLAQLRQRADARAAEIDAIAAQMPAASPAEQAALERDLATVERAEQVLVDRLAEMEVEVAATSGGLTVADEAIDATEAPAPKPTHLAVLGALIAAVLAAAVLYARLSYAAARQARSAGTGTGSGDVIDLDHSPERRSTHSGERRPGARGQP